jgi:CheY-like chemotaxis protein
MWTGFAPRVLLVDDDPSVLDALRIILEANGFICRTAGDGIEALRDLPQAPPDIIISDLRMPKMSGFELLPILRQRFPQIAVIASSAEPISTVEASGLPMSAYFQKGAYTSEQLVAAIREVMSLSQSRGRFPRGT